MQIQKAKASFTCIIGLRISSHILTNVLVQCELWMCFGNLKEKETMAVAFHQIPAFSCSNVVSSGTHRAVDVLPRSIFLVPPRKSHTPMQMQHAGSAGCPKATSFPRKRHSQERVQKSKLLQFKMQVANQTTENPGTLPTYVS